MSYYTTIYTGGDPSGKQVATIYLYPFDSLYTDCGLYGVVSSAISRAYDAMVDHASIDGYEVLRFNVPDYNDPANKVTVTESDIESTFRDFLKNDNGTGSNLYSQVGAHVLIHDNQAACDETGGRTSDGSYAPPVVGGEASGGTTCFTNGLMLWSAVCDNNKSLTEAAAVQEPTHHFVNHDSSDTYDGGDEHSLGKRIVDSSGDPAATPMLAFHWDDNLDPGTCTNDTSSTPITHTAQPSPCTKDAVRDTADDEIPENL